RAMRPTIGARPSRSSCPPRSEATMSTTAPSLPDALSPAAREWLESADSLKLLIGGERVDAADGRTFETPDPSTGKTIAEVAWAGAEDVDRAVRAARAAFDDGKWPSLIAAKRSALMHGLADLIEDNAD